MKAWAETRHLHIGGPRYAVVLALADQRLSYSILIRDDTPERRADQQLRSFARTLVNLFPEVEFCERTLFEIFYGMRFAARWLGCVSAEVP